MRTRVGRVAAVVGLSLGIAFSSGHTANAQAIILNKVTIQGGLLVVTGNVGVGNILVTLEGIFSTTSLTVGSSILVSFTTPTTAS